MCTVVGSIELEFEVQKKPEELAMIRLLAGLVRWN